MDGRGCVHVLVLLCCTGLQYEDRGQRAQESGVEVTRKVAPTLMGVGRIDESAAKNAVGRFLSAQNVRFGAWRLLARSIGMVEQ
jgi:hypothetical protein